MKLSNYFVKKLQYFRELFQISVQKCHFFQFFDENGHIFGKKNGKTLRNPKFS